MRLEAVHTSVPATLPSEFPLKLEQKTANAGPVIMLMILVPLAGALLAPFLMLLEGLLTDPGLRANVVAHPMSAVQVILAFGIWCALFAWPIKRLAAQLARSRTVEIGNGIVHITDRSVLSEKSWRLPISDYTGVCHHVRSSLSGVRHELVLNHWDHRRSVLIAMQPRMAEADIAQVQKLFTAGVSPALDLYRRLEEVYAVASTDKFATSQKHAA